jgi:hypothetical protein
MRDKARGLRFNGTGNALTVDPQSGRTMLTMSVTMNSDPTPWLTVRDMTIFMVSGQSGARHASVLGQGISVAPGQEGAVGYGFQGLAHRIGMYLYWPGDNTAYIEIVDANNRLSKFDSTLGAAV